MDFYIMDKVTSFLEAIPRLNLEFLSMKDSVEQFRQVMVPQLDLRCEAKNLERFRVNFAGTKTVNFPEPMEPFVTENVLVEGFVRGDRILTYLSPKADPADKKVRRKKRHSLVRPRWYGL